MKSNTTGMYGLMSSYVSKSDIYAASVIAKISAFIINYRNKTGMTQKEFAEYMGITQGMVSKWESADYNFSVDSIAKIAEKLSYSFDIQLTPENEYLDSQNKFTFNNHHYNTHSIRNNSKIIANAA